MDSQKPFLVKSYQCWLLDPPHYQSPIVKHHMVNLIMPKSVLTDFSELKEVVDGALALVDAKMSNNTLICSQCNRLVKHFQATAAHIANYQHFAHGLVKAIHQAMKFLFEIIPPREIAAQEIVMVVAAISAIIHETANNLLFQVMKIHKLLVAHISESTIVSCTENTLLSPDQSEILEYTSIFLRFWEALAIHLRLLHELSKEIQPSAKVNIQDDMEKFEVFKEKVMELSSGWVAVERVSFIYNKQLSFGSSNVQSYIENKLMFPNSCCFVSTSQTIDAKVHFQEIATILMTEDTRHAMPDNITVYSTWIQPKLSVNMTMCMDVAYEALQLKKKASKHFLEFKRMSKQIATVAQIYVERLKFIELYAERQQEIVMKSRLKLEGEKQKKMNLIKNKKTEIEKLSNELKNSEAMITEAQHGKAKAEEENASLHCKNECLEKKLKQLEEQKVNTEGLLKENEKKLKILRQQAQSFTAAKVESSQDINTEALEEAELKPISMSQEKSMHNDQHSLNETDDSSPAKELSKYEKRKAELEHKLREIDQCAQQICIDEIDNEINLSETTNEARSSNHQNQNWFSKLKKGLHTFKEMIKSNQKIVTRQRKTISQYEDKKKKIKKKIRGIEMQLSKVQDNVQELTIRISQISDEQTYRVETLQEMKEATAILKRSIFHFDEFISKIEHAKNRAEFAKKISEKIEGSKKSEEIKSSKGTQLVMKKFTDAFEDADKLLQLQWQHIVRFKYKCTLCNKDKEGLPLPIDDDAVICCSCAETLVFTQEQF